MSPPAPRPDTPALRRRLRPRAPSSAGRSGPPSPAGETKDRRWRSPRSAPPVVLVLMLWLLPCLLFSFNQGLIYRKFSIHAAEPLSQPDGLIFFCRNPALRITRAAAPLPQPN